MKVRSLTEVKGKGTLVDDVGVPVKAREDKAEGPPVQRWVIRVTQRDEQGRIAALEIMSSG